MNIFKQILIHIIFITFLNVNVIYSKNIILNINKVSFEDYIGQKLIDDYINYDIFTEIKAGTPPQKVTHFINGNDKIFQFKKIEIMYNTNKFNRSVIKFIDSQFYLFNSSLSSTYKGSFSDNFIFETNGENNFIEVKNLNFTIYYNNRETEVKYGIIGLLSLYENDNNSFFNELYAFVSQLKKRNIISEYIFFFVYDEEKSLFQSNKNIGKIIIGEYPHEFYNNINIFNKDDMINIYSSSSSSWSMLCDEIKFNYEKENYIEKNMNLIFDFNSKFIKGSNDYNKKIKSIFFNELINQNLCKSEKISGNKDNFKYEIYSCYNNYKFLEKLKNFPILYFINRSSNAIFSFSYKDLFILFENKFYFMIIFWAEKYTFFTDTWFLGEIFMKKYIGAFNLESRYIAFYNNQIKNIPNNLEKLDEKSNKYIRIVFEVIMGIIIIICIFLLYRKYKKTRKLHANELEDNNYDYLTSEKKIEI